MESQTVVGGNGTNIVIEATGSPSNIPLVFIHGYSQSRLCWKHQFSSDLTDDFHVVRFDIRGHGDSDKPGGGYADPELWATDVQAVIDSIEADEVILIGWSYGGLIMSDYLCVSGTEDILGLNYVSAISEKGTDDAAKFAGEEFAAMADGFESTDAKESVETLSNFVDLCVATDLSPEDHHLMLGYNVKTPPHVRKSLQARTVENEGTLKNLDVPVLLTHGDADPVVSIGAARKHADLIPDADLSIYEGGGHSPFWEEPERFNNELREFADRITS